MTRTRSRRLVSVASLLLAALPLTAQTHSLKTRDPLIAPVPAANAVPEGETFLIRLNDTLDTGKLKGHVSSVEQGIHARMLLSFDEIDTGHGKMPLIATVTGVPSEHAAKQPDGEGMIERKGMSKGHMIESVAVGAGVGAIAGGAIKGGKGAGIGAGAGAGMGA